MTKLDLETRDLAAQLIRAPSVSPEDAGCQAMMADYLAALGFSIRKLPFGPVENLWAVHDAGVPGPLFAFAGHTDVVPPGPLENWHTDPFDPVIDGDMLFGRGAADMKGSLAAMMTGVKRFLAQSPNHAGRIGFLITSDEEADAVDGTVKAIAALEAEGEHIDYCLVGEPSSSRQLGDVVRVGRRGSLNATLTVRGIQGHVAYPDDASNPIHLAMQALADLAAETWDEGNAYFPPTSMQISNLNSGTGANNVIPPTLTAVFNFRFSTESSEESLKARTQHILERHKLPCDIAWSLSGNPFLTREQNLIGAVQGAISSRLGIETELSTSGGTSDGRFIAPYGTEVVELGPTNATIHKVNECTSLKDLYALSDVHTHILAILLAD